MLVLLASVAVMLKWAEWLAGTFCVDYLGQWCPNQGHANYFLIEIKRNVEEKYDIVEYYAAFIFWPTALNQFKNKKLI